MFPRAVFAALRTVEEGMYAIFAAAPSAPVINIPAVAAEKP